MTSNCDRSKTIPVISKTTKNYHPRADDPPLRTEDEKPLPVYNCTLKVCPPRRLVANFSCLSIKIVKLAFHWRWIFAFVAGGHVWHVAAPWLDPDGVTWIYHNRFRSSSGQLLYSHKNTVFFFPFWPGHSQKNAFLDRANKRVQYVAQYPDTSV